MLPKSLMSTISSPRREADLTVGFNCAKIEKISVSSHNNNETSYMAENLMENPNFAKAMEWMMDNDLNALAAGKHVIDGDNLWVNIVDAELKTVEQARLEVHDSYIDIQIPLSGPETFGVKARSECTKPAGEMDPEKDILFFDDEIEEVIEAAKGQVVTFAPDTAHAPLIGEGNIHKAIFKVKVA